VKRHWEESEKTAAKAAIPQLQFDLLTGSPDSDDDRATLPVADLEAEEDAQVAAATAESSPPSGKDPGKLFAEEQRLLDEMTEIAENGRVKPDARVRTLLDWIRKNMCPGLGKPGAKWNDVRIIIFTEYDDTKRYLHEQLGTAIEGTDRAEQRIAIYHGPTPPDEREAIKQAFNQDPKQHPVRILIATDAAREGLNLQAHCWNLFHFDVPWNPSRMEQRNGRIDRKLQEEPKVFCHYFVYSQRPEDRILQVLVAKTERIKKELGSLGQVIDARLAETLRSGIRRDRIEKLEKEIREADLDANYRKTVEEELESSRQRQDELREQVDRLRDVVAKSKASIGLDDEQFRQAISCALELLGAEPLKAEDKHAEPIPRFHFPALDQREAADPTWADTLDTLRAPRERGQKLWEWRRSSPIRPIIFEDPGKIDDTIVHLHLEHRIVQRLLSRFIAQGFVHHDLSRACLPDR
jgi:superfamily II DNA/RNA helicase